MIDDTVKELLRAVRDAKTIETCEALRQRVASEIPSSYSREACFAAIVSAEQAILDSYKFDIANEAL